MQVEALDELCAVGSITFHIHGERRPNGGPPTVQNIGHNVTVILSTNLQGYTSVARAMEDVFTRDIAVSFAQTWHAQAVETGYLSTNTLPVVASPPRVPGAARVFSPPPTLSRTASVLPQMPDSLPSTPTHKVVNTKLFPPPHPTKTAPPLTTLVSKKTWSRSPTKPSSTSSADIASPPSSMSSLSSGSSSTVSTVIAGPEISYHRNIFQTQKSLPQEMLDILTDLGCSGGEEITFVTHLYLNVEQNKWFPMMKNRFALDDDVLLLLVRTMKER
jgi:hypothetical protein